MSEFNKDTGQIIGEWRIREATRPLSPPFTLKGPYKTVYLKSRGYKEITDKEHSLTNSEFITLPGFQKSSLDELFSICQDQILGQTTPEYWIKNSEAEFTEKRDETLKRIQKDDQLPLDDLASFSSFLEQIFAASNNSLFIREKDKDPLSNQLIARPENLEKLEKPGLHSEVLKIKLSKKNLAELADSLEKLLQNFSFIRFRLDGNRQLNKSDIFTFHQNCSERLKAAIDYYEEPCQSIDEHLRLGQHLPLGLDETLRHYQQKILIREEKDSSLQELVNRSSSYICKPLLHGGPLSARNLFYHLKKQNPRGQFIISHCFEGSIGLQWNKKLAQWVDEQQGTKNYHGIGSTL